MLINNEDHEDENYHKMFTILKNENIQSDDHEFRDFIYLIANIADNHFRSPTFFAKIEKILIYFSKEIKQTFTNDELFDVFSQNKKILLFLIGENFINIDKSIIDKMKISQSLNLTQFFSPEISEFDDKEHFFKPPKNFCHKREKGINDNALYQIIQNDMIDEFSQYVEDTDFQLQTKIESSLYETNLFLLKNEPTIIEYSAFYGSINIFKYCYLKGANVTSSIWLYAIHGNNIEIIQFLEKNQIKPPSNSYENCLKEAIKCHHNDIAIYIQNTFIGNRIENYDINNNLNKDILKCVFQYHNYAFFPKNYNYKFIVHYLFEYKYYNLIILLFESRLINFKHISQIEKNSFKDYNFDELKNDEQINKTDKTVIKSNESTNAIYSSGIYFNTKLSFNDNEIQIGSTKIKIEQIKECYFLGLNEAFSTSPDEHQFINAIEIFDKIIESKIDGSYSDISQIILNEVNSINDSVSSDIIRKELIDLIFDLFPNASQDEVNKAIDDCGGMINYILPILFKNNSITTKRKVIEINESFISAGLLLFYHEAVNSQLIKSTPFSFWKQDKNSEIKLTRIARNRISSSKYPCIAMLFGSLRTGKSTLASHLVGGPNSFNSKETLFKSAGSSKSCTKSINSIGPIKINDFSSSFGIFQDEFNNTNLNRDIFIVDSEGLNSFDVETPWLKKALLTMLSVNTVSLYVAKSMNKADLDQFMKYIKLVRVIGGNEIHHRLGYINNQEKFDGSNIMEQLLEQDKSSTNKIINDFSQIKSLNLDESHFKFLSVLSFDRYQRNDYFNSLSEVARFIVNACTYEKTIITGEMIVDILEEFADKMRDNDELNDGDMIFETIFIRVIEKAFNKSIQEQIPEIQREISINISSMPIVELNLLNVDKYVARMEKNGFIQKIIDKAVEKTLPDIEESFPFIVNASRINLINIIKNIVHYERKKLIPVGVFEVPDLGYGFSVLEGTFKKKVLDLKLSNSNTKIKIVNDVFTLYHLPEHFMLNSVPERFKKIEIDSSSTFKNFLLSITPKVFNDEQFSFFSPKYDYDRSVKFVENLIGISFAQTPENLEVFTSIKINAIAQVNLNVDDEVTKSISSDLKKKFDDLEKALHEKGIESTEVEKKVTQIHSEYGEFVASQFFVGNYTLNISTNYKKLRHFSNSIMTKNKGKPSFYSTKKSIQNSNKTNSHDIKVSYLKINISYGSQINPATFMLDIAQSSSFESSFIPLSKFASSQKVAQALEHWKGKSGKKPKTLIEYLRLNGLMSVPKGRKIILFSNENVPYEVIINNDGQLEIPDSTIQYDFRSEEKGEVLKSYSEYYHPILDPTKMTIGGFCKQPYEKKWKRRTGHHRRAHGNEHLYLSVRLNPFWEFEQKITKNMFEGEGVNYMKISSFDNQSFKIEFQNLPDGSGKSWTKGPYKIKLKQDLKVKLV